MDSAKRRRGRTQREVEECCLDLLTRRAEGMTKRELQAAIGDTSAPTLQRALARLRSEESAPIECTKGVWRLTEPHRRPLERPEAEDVAALLLASSIVERVAGPSLGQRLRDLAESLDDRRRAGERERVPAAPRIAPATLSLATRVDPEVLSRVLRSSGRGVIRFAYHGVWEDTHTTRVVEPWTVRIHEGAAYLRAWCRRSAGPRTFRLAQMTEVEVLEGERPREPRPAGTHAWGAEAPEFGVDAHHPGEATVRLRGPLARWAFYMVWHPDQQDRWLESTEPAGESVLERRLKYRSRREFARRLLQVLDGIVDLEPEELRAEVDALVGRSAQGRLA